MKYIAFSLFGSDPKYLKCLLATVKSAPEFFPNWNLLVYCDSHNYALLTAESSFSHVEYINHATLSRGAEGTTWRFFAALRPEAEVILFRDADSFFTQRERFAVEKWLSSDFDAHIIRDHPYHQSPIMAGLFGVRRSAKQILASLVSSSMQRRRLTEYGDDQTFLSLELYPKIRNRVLVHTNCIRYFPEYTSPLPKDELGQRFIGAYAFLDDIEQEKYEAVRRTELPITLIPDDLKRIPILSKLLDRINGKRRLKHHTKWRY